MPVIRFVRSAPALLCALLVAAPALLPAQPSSKVARAARVTRAPRIDGRLDDAAWARLSPIDDFVQRQRLEPCVRSRHRCGRGEPSPGADGRGEPSRDADDVGDFA